MSPWTDRISALPDELLHRILSFLPTKYAAATITLSKRWKPLLSILKLDDQHFPDPSTFRQFFNSFITNTDKTQPIFSFHLICRHANHYSKHDIPNFVNTVLQRGLQNLTIDLSNSLFPTFVLTTKFLSFLKLMRLQLDDFPSFDLPSLKSLYLESITFDRYSFIVQILNACPVLEELETKDLTVKKGYSVPVLNEEEMKREYMGPNCPSVHVIGLSKLARANISGLHILYYLLNNVDHLQLHMMFPYPLHNAMFHNLTYVNLVFDFLPCLRLSKWNWVMDYLLPNSPKLQTLIIDEVDTVNDFGDKDEWEDPDLVPECLLCHLTTCSIRNYSRINWELPFAKYIMQNSNVLSTMTIHIAESVESGTKIQMREELSSSTMNSATCELLFI